MKPSVLLCIAVALALVMVIPAGATEVCFEPFYVYSSEADGSGPNGPIVTTPYNLQNGMNYKITSAEIFYYNYGGPSGPNYAADAQWYTTLLTWPWANYLKPAGAFLQISDDGTTWEDPDWGDYNSAHVYSIDHIGTGSPLSLRIYDWVDEDISNNYCHFNVTICEEGWEGCTLTPGYWKNHGDNSKKQYDETWDLIGPDTEFFDSGKSFMEVLKTPPSGGDEYYILAHAWIAAYLNVLNGAGIPEEVEDAWNEAEDYFSGIPADRSTVIEWAELLDDYNNGLIGPGHCDAF